MMTIPVPGQIWRWSNGRDNGQFLVMVIEPLSRPTHPGDWNWDNDHLKSAMFFKTYIIWSSVGDLSGACENYWPDGDCWTLVSDV